MKVVVQRARAGKVTVDDQIVGSIKYGLLLLVGISHEDTLKQVEYCAKKVANMRIFADEADKMNLSVKSVEGEILSVSQFTLYGDMKKGNRPSFDEAAKPEVARVLYDQFNNILAETYGLKVETGVFGAMMEVSFINDGPVTIMIET